MILHNEFTVASDLETVWAQILDVEGVADCVPGATIEEVEPPNVYKGAIRVRIGPMTVDYKGQATLTDVDDEAHSATILLKAREEKGQGSAVATVKNRLEDAGGGTTRVVADTDLKITGPQAQFGKGVLEDVGSRVLEEFSKRLEERIVAEARGGGPEGTALNGGKGAKRLGRADEEEAEVLDLGRVMAQSMLERTGAVAAVVAALAVVVAAALLCRARRRSGASRR